ncbi:MAG: dTDP-4-dehydrorhamnose reductase [Cyanobacteria bacterium P01_F01_bin.42]
MDKILLIGAAGQVGQELTQTLPALGEVIAVSRTELDLTDSDAISTTIQRTQPQIIVNAAAYTAVDRAETESELAHQINDAAPGAIAQAAERLNARLVHISTDYVFDGTKGSPYLEDDPTRPIGTYGQSKLAGEQAVAQDCSRHIILRTAWVYGVHGKGNFVKTMLRLGCDRESLSVVADQIGTPTWSKDIAEAIVALLQRQSESPDEVPSGIYHFTNSGAASWYDFAQAIFEEAQAIGFPIKLKTLNPITTADYPTPAQRPAYSVLGWTKTAQAIGHSAPHWRSSLRQMLKDFKSAQS